MEVALLLSVHAASLALYIAVPGVSQLGYVCDVKSNKPLLYTLNGLRVYGLMLALAAAAVLLQLVSPTAIHDRYWRFAATGCLTGALLSAVLLATSARQPQRRAPTAEYAVLLAAAGPGQAAATLAAPPHQIARLQSDVIGEEALDTRGKGLLYDYYIGMQFNPRYFHGRLDVKMWLYLVGAIVLQLVLLSALAAHSNATHGNVSLAMVLYQSMFAWFIIEYLYFENVHLFTYDFFAEKIGFKLTWGCLCFYPFFYSIGVWSLVPAVPADHQLSPAAALAILLLFFAGWCLTRGANMQKYYSKVAPTMPFLGIKRLTIDGTSILICGFWALARHINYFGEILQALALALTGYLTTGSLVPLLYPLYYLAILIPRQFDDDKLCELKYGRVWQQYMMRVPYRIIPFVF